jgi:hypothetical protein
MKYQNAKIAKKLKFNRKKELEKNKIKKNQK